MKDEQTVAKGFLKGVLWGTGVSIGALALISVVDDGQGETRLSAPREPSSQQSVQTNQPADRTGGAGPSAVGLIAEDVPAPEPDTLAELLSDALAPAAVPQAGAASDLSAGQDTQTNALDGIAQPMVNAPKVTYAESGSLETPRTEPGISVSTDPAQPVAPVAVPQETAFAEPDISAEQPPNATADPVTDGNAGTDGLAAEKQENTAPTVSASLDPEKPSLPVPDTETSGFDAQSEKVNEEPAIESLSEGETVPQAQTQIAALAQDDSASEPPPVASSAPLQPETQPIVSDAIPAVKPESVAPETKEALDLATPDPVEQDTQEGDSTTAQIQAEISVETPEVVDVTEAENTVVAQADSTIPDPQAAKPLPILAAENLSVGPDVIASAAQPEKDRPVDNTPSTAVRINRLPTLASVPETEVIDPVEQAPIPEVVEAPEEPPIDQFAAEFENEDAKPVMAIILIDDGVDLSASSVGISALRELPYPVSFAVDALLPDAAARMQSYRDAGFEVLASVDLPEGAQAADAEVNLSVALDALPEVVGVLDGVRTGVQTTPDAGKQVAQILAQTGHGFVTQNRGLNTVQKLAAREGVPSAVVFRDFDAKGQSSAVIRRFLDQAAFRAGQEGAVIMLGRLREETLGALVLWTLQDRASSVAMAPVSAALKRVQ